MTRNEAIRTMQNIANNHDYRGAEYWTDVLCALGILKLDEPKSEVTRLALALGWPEGARSEGELLDALYNAGLRIVEK